VNLYKILDKEVCHLIENMKLYVIEADETMVFVTTNTLVKATVACLIQRYYIATTNIQLSNSCKGNDTLNHTRRRTNSRDKFLAASCSVFKRHICN
jgi:hypothetical protein